MPAARRTAAPGAPPTGAYPVSFRVFAGSADALRLDRAAALHGGRSAALRAALLALEACDAARDATPQPPPQGGKPPGL